jgi:Sec-independent protein secretion pathway component TatC
MLDCALSSSNFVDTVVALGLTFRIILELPLLVVLRCWQWLGVVVGFSRDLVAWRSLDG